MDLVFAQLRLDDSNPQETQLLQSYIAAARRHAEAYTRRAFYPQVVRLGFDQFPIACAPGNNTQRLSPTGLTPVIEGMTIRLPRPSCIDVQGVTYLGGNGVRVTLPPDRYTLDLESEPARITPPSGGSWPTANLYIPGSVQIDYLAGSYAEFVTEEIVVSGAQPYTTLISTPPIGCLKITGADLQTVPFSQDGLSITILDSSLAGQTLTATYYKDACPEVVRVAMLMLIADWYRNREDTSDIQLARVPNGVRALLDDEVCYGGVFEA